MVAPFTGPFASTHLFRCATSFKEEEEGAHSLLQEARVHSRRLQGLSKRIFYFFSIDLCSSNKFFYFSFEKVLDHAYKVYEGKESQTLISWMFSFY